MDHKLDQASRIYRLAARGWVSLTEFAQLVGVSHPTIVRMRDAKNFHCIEVGTQHRVYVDEVERFLKYGNLQSDPNEQRLSTGDVNDD